MHRPRVHPTHPTTGKGERRKRSGEKERTPSTRDIVSAPLVLLLLLRRIRELGVEVRVVDRGGTIYEIARVGLEPRGGEGEVFWGEGDKIGGGGADLGGGRGCGSESG